RQPLRPCSLARIAGGRSAPRAACMPSPPSRPSQRLGGTWTSTARRLRAPTRRLFLGAQLVLAALVLFFVGRALVEQWQTFRSVPLVAQPRWSAIVLSGVLVLITYALLV